VGEVSQHLRSLEANLSQIEVAEKLEGDRQQERRRLEAQQEPIAEELAELDQVRADLASKLQLNDVPDVELVDVARAIDQLREAQADESAANANAAEIAGYRDDVLNLLNEVFESYGLPAYNDSAKVKAQLGKLIDLSASYERAENQFNTANDEIEKCEAEIERHQNGIDDKYRDVGLQPNERTKLNHFLDQLSDFKELCRQRDVLEISVDRIKQNLIAKGSGDLCDLGSEQLQAKKIELEDKAARLEQLHEEIKEIEIEVRNARAGHALEDTLADRNAALIELDERRTSAMQCEAARFLVNSIQEEHETTQMPRVLERARELFSIFTHHSYELKVSPDQDGSFIAVESRTGAGKTPNELSDGTRAQLLLAVRLAFAEDVEKGVKLPIFLDEALDQSDPERFGAISRSLGQIAEDTGRQIFYLTNDPNDLAAIQESLRQEGYPHAHLIDLAAVRQKGVSIKESESLIVPEIPTVPAPAGMSHEEYAAELGIPAFDPSRGAPWQHLYYLAWDGLNLLHRLLSDRIVHVGQWITLERNKAKLVAKIKSEFAIGVQLADRAALLEEFCHAWQEGRGRKVEWDVIERSGAVTPKYLDAVNELVAELDGNGIRLIAELKARNDDRVRGFMTKKAEALEKVLIDEGYIDERPILDESEVLTRTLSVPAANELPEKVVSECIHRWWNLSAQVE
jgi:hypothetical protein